MLDLRLRTKVTIVMILVTSLVIVINAGILSLDFTKRYTIALQSEAKAHASGFVREILNTLASGKAINDIEGLDDKCSQVVSDNVNIGYAMVMDAEGQILYHSNSSKEARDSAAKWLDGINNSSEEKYVVKNVHYLGENFFDISMPVYTSGPISTSGGINSSARDIHGYVSIGLYEKVVSDAKAGAAIVTIFVALGSFLLVVIVSFFLGNTVTGPINKVTLMLKDIAEGKGDLTKRMNVESNDEIGELAHWVDKFMDDTQAMIKKFRDTTSLIYEAAMSISSYSSAVSEGAESQSVATENTSSSIDEMKANFSQIASNIDNLSSTTEEASSSILEMAASIDEVAHISEDLSSSVDAVSSSVEEMSVTIREVAGVAEELSVSADSTVASVVQITASIKEVEKSARDSASVANDTATDAEKGMASVEKTIEGMNKIKHSVNEAGEVIRKLGERSNDIGEILTVIDEVAEQTNLLALNAAIIAAQAGEHGKGFAVVSDEIMDLSERTAASTKEISMLIKSLQKESDNAVRSMELGLKRVEEGADLSEEAGSSLKKILDGANKSKDMIGHIASATVEQQRASEQVKEAMESVNQIVMRIAQATLEQSKGSELIVQATEVMKDSTGHVKRATQEQSKGGRQIAGSIEKITTMTNFVNKATHEQAKGVELVVVDIDEIQNLTGKYGEAANGMQQSVDLLVHQTEILGEEIKKFKV